MTEIKKQVEHFKKELLETSAQIHPTRLRLEAAERHKQEIELEIEALKVERQRILAEGTEPAPLSKKIDALEKELSLKGEEITGLKAKSKQLSQMEVNLSGELKGAELRALQLQSLDAAKRYNALAEQLAESLKALKAVHKQIDTISNQLGPYSRRVVWGPETGALKSVPRLFFDSDGPELEEFMARHSGFNGTHPNTFTKNHEGAFFFHE